MKIESEIWKDIKGYEGLYQVSNLGRIKSFSKRKELIRKPTKNKKRNGYLEISLFKNNKEKRFKVHRLVAEAFIPNPENKEEVNHIDGNKSNNNKNNLEWVTDKENKEHAWKNGLMNSNHKKVKIICNETKEEFESVVECSIKMDIDRRSIFRQLKGERKTAGGYTFKRLEGGK